MRLCWVIALLICLIGGASALVHPDHVGFFAPNLRVASQSRIVNKANASRVLKYRMNEADNNDGERSLLSSIAGVLSKTSPTLANNLWLKSKTNPEKVFTILRLGEAGAKLDDNPKFLQWLKYVNTYSKLEYRSYSNYKVFDLLRKTNSDEELVVLFQSLRQASGMKDVADSMQRILFASSPTSHRLLIEAWLKYRETPVNVFNILRLGEPKGERNSMFLLWFKYTEMYRSTMGGDTFSTSRTYKLVLDAFPEKLPSQFAEFFQLVKQTPDLKNLGEKMQNDLFKSLVDRKFTPETFRGQLGVPGVTPVFELRKDDIVYKALEDFTIFYTAKQGGKEALKTVRDLFANDKPEEAFAVAMKV